MSLHVEISHPLGRITLDVRFDCAAGLTALIGRRAWWPGHAAEPQAPAGQLTREAAR